MDSPNVFPNDPTTFPSTPESLQQWFENEQKNQEPPNGWHNIIGGGGGLSYAD